MAMKNPPHPGRSIKRNCLDPLGLSVTEAAKVLGVARHTLSRVLNGRAAVSPAMAIRLEKAGWSNAEFWRRRQTTYDLAQAHKGEHRIKVEPYPPLVTPQGTSFKVFDRQARAKAEEAKQQPGTGGIGKSPFNTRSEGPGCS